MSTIPTERLRAFSATPYAATTSDAKALADELLAARERIAALEAKVATLMAQLAASGAYGKLTGGLVSVGYRNVIGRYGQSIVFDSLEGERPKTKPDPAAEPSQDLVEHWIRLAMDNRLVGDWPGTTACIIKAIGALAREVRR